MSREKVYLFELDSRRFSNAEIDYAYYKVFMTLYIENKDVVLSYNQIVDSSFMFDLYCNTAMRDILKTLFEEKRLCISQYRTYTTPKDYLLKSAGNEKFVFSIINRLKGKYGDNEKEEIKDAIKDALTNSHNSPFGLKFIIPDDYDTLVAYRSYIEFFSELKYQLIPSVNANHPSFFSFDSLMKLVNTNPHLSDIKKQINGTHSTFDNFFKATFTRDYKIQKKVCYVLNTEKSRSPWIDDIEWWKEHLTTRCSLESSLTKQYITELELLEKIVDTCYNITVESSIQMVKGRNPQMNIVDYIKEKFNGVEDSITNIQQFKDPKLWNVAAVISNRKKSRFFEKHGFAVVCILLFLFVVVIIPYCIKSLIINFQGDEAGIKTWSYINVTISNILSVAYTWLVHVIYKKKITPSLISILKVCASEKEFSNYEKIIHELKNKYFTEE